MNEKGDYEEVNKLNFLSKAENWPQIETKLKSHSPGCRTVFNLIF